MSVSNPLADQQSPALSVAEKQYPLPPSILDSTAYTGPAQFEREMSELFFKLWVPAFPAADLPNPKDFVVWERIRQSVVIVRQEDGSLRAWHNVCQHRGARLAKGSGNCAKAKFLCPWHGFSYNLAGEVKNVPLRDSFDEAELKGLRAPPVRVREWSGMIWLSMAQDGPELLEFLGDIGTELSWYGMERYTAPYRVSLELNANWKMVVDAFNETWHVPFTHLDTLSGLMLWRDARLKITPPHSWMTLPVRDFTERAGAQADHRAANVCHYLSFPNTIFSCFPTHLQTWSVWPVSPTKTILDAWGLCGQTPAGDTDEKWARRTKRDWDHFLNVVAEDSGVINDLGAMQQSLGFRRNMFCTAEGRLTAFHAEVARRV